MNPVIRLRNSQDTPEPPEKPERFIVLRTLGRLADEDRAALRQVLAEILGG